MKLGRSRLKIMAAASVVMCTILVLPDLCGQALSDELVKNFTYRSIGPTRQSGRFVDFALPEQEPYTIYAATASGGLWKSVNNGITFEPIFDHENVFSIGDIAVAPSDPKIVWVGTGEANNSRSVYWGDGVYKSTDAGKTWKNMGLKESHHVGRIVIHPKNPDIVYVAALGHLYSENPDRGLYMTSDGGKTWKKALEVIDHGKYIGAVDVAMHPLDPNVLYASTYDKVRKPYTFNLGGPGSGIYKSTDAGQTWTKLGGGLPAGMLGKIGVAVATKNPNTVYAVIENANKPGMSDEARYQELLNDKSSDGIYGNQAYRSDDAGKTWTQVSPKGYVLGGGTPYYYGQIRVDPNDDNHVWSLSTSVDHSTDGGKTWTEAFDFGGDNHGLWIDPKDSKHIILGYDHGMGITYDGGKTWYHPDFLPLAQFYAIDFDMSYPYNVAGGLQDNGSVKGPNTRRDGGPIRLEDWERVGGGDGMYNVFDRMTNRYLYNESQFGPLGRIDLKTGERKSIAYQNIRRDLRWNWNSPILVSPHDSNVIYHGGNILVKSPYRGESWQEISTDLTTNDPKKLTTGKGGDGNIQHCTITTIDESPLVQGLLWVGTDDGNVWVTRDDGKAWKKLNDRITGNPGYWVSRVTASNNDPGTAYVSYTGFRQDDFRPFLYKTTDYGETWTSIAANLPNEPVNVIREDYKNPNLLFVGTEFAVFVSIDAGKSWTKLKGDMPTQPVQDLKIHPRDNDLIVATHGRGVFIAEMAFLRELTPQVLAKDAHLFDIDSVVKWINPRTNHSSSSNFEGESEPIAMSISYYLKNQAGDVKVSIFKGNMLVNELKGKGEAGVNSVVWDLMQRRERTEQEKKDALEMNKRAQARGGRGAVDPNFILSPANYGEYKIVLSAAGQEFVKYASILEDIWYDRQ